MKSIEFSWFLSAWAILGPIAKVHRAETKWKNLRFSLTFCGFMTLDSEATLPNHGKTLCFHSLFVFSLLFEIVAAVDKEPGEPGEVVDGGTKK